MISGNHYAQKASTLITLDQAITTCSPPSDMKESREGHAIGMSGGNLTVCGGSRLKTCSFYDKCKAEWIPVSEELYNIRDKFPWVQLDKNRIWIGREPLFVVTDY